MLYAKRYAEGYDIDDPSYVAWLKINHAEKCLSVSSDIPEQDSSSTFSVTTSSQDNVAETSSK
jgi:hypothetical protein